MATCPNCQRPVSIDVNFCGSCGRLMREEPDSVTLCPACRSLISGDPKFCGKCGSPLEQERTSDTRSLPVDPETTACVPDGGPGRVASRDSKAQSLGSKGLPEPVRQLARQARRGRGPEQDELMAILVGRMRAGQILFAEPVPRNLALSLENEGWSPYAASFFADRVMAMVAPKHVDSDDHDVLHDVPIWDFLIGIPCVLIGAGTTIGTYLSAAPGESYVIWWGIIIYGGFRLISGIVKMASR